jgi:hypothetical protein
LRNREANPEVRGETADYATHGNPMTLTTPATTTTPACRLCGGATAPAFRATVLGKYDAPYLRCTACESLQPADPHWLDEAYRNAARSVFDVGAADRILNTRAITWAVAKLFRVRGRLLDFGGGDGLLCRLLRDAGFDAYTADKYSDVRYAKGFEAEPGPGLEMITAFEVLEHFTDPAGELAALFAHRPRLLLASTGVYRGQGPDWPYLSTETGQHVFLYSPQAFEWIARRHGYHAFLGSGFILWSAEPISRFRRVALKLMRYRTQRLLQGWVALKQPRSIQRDFEMLVRRGKQGDQ